MGTSYPAGQGSASRASRSCVGPAAGERPTGGHAPDKRASGTVSAIRTRSPYFSIDSRARRHLGKAGNVCGAPPGTLPRNTGRKCGVVYATIRTAGHAAPEMEWGGEGGHTDSNRAAASTHNRTTSYPWSGSARSGFTEPEVPTFEIAWRRARVAKKAIRGGGGPRFG